MGGVTCVSACHSLCVCLCVYVCACKHGLPRLVAMCPRLGDRVSVILLAVRLYDLIRCLSDIVSEAYKCSCFDHVSLFCVQSCAWSVCFCMKWLVTIRMVRTSLYGGMSPVTLYDSETTGASIC